MALLILALLQRIFLMSSLMLLLVWLIFFMVLIKLLPILGTISGKTVKLMVLALICLGNNRQDSHLPNCMFSCLQILEAFLWFVLITLLNVTLIIVGYSNFSQPQSHLSFCVLLQYLVERRRVVTQLGKLDYDATPDRKSGSAGMPRPISYAVFCLKKKNM